MRLATRERKLIYKCGDCGDAVECKFTFAAGIRFPEGWTSHPEKGEMVCPKCSPNDREKVNSNEK